MKPITRILAPLDFSSHSRAALDWAIDLALRFRASLWLVHVHEPPGFMMPGGYVPPPAELVAEEHRAREQMLLAARARAVEAGITEVDTFLLPGDVAHEILRIADEGDCGVIVMGTHGRTGLSHTLFGSVAERVTRRAPCPVLTSRAAE